MDFSPQPKKFRYTVNNEAIDNAPDSFLNTVIKFTKSSAYGGIIRNFTLPVKFVLNAATILRSVFYKSGVIFSPPFLIEQLIPKTWGYKTLFNGKLDFSKAQDHLANFTCNAVPNDFSANIDAYDSVQYAIPLKDGINLELTPITLNEIANLLPTGPPDGVVHSDYFPPIQVVNNQQNSVNQSVYNVPYGQLRAPDFSALPNYFFRCRYTGKLLISGSLSLRYQSLFPRHLKIGIYNQAGTEVVNISEIVNFVGDHTYIADINTALNVTVGDKLFLYMSIVEAEVSGSGITVTGGEIDLSYQTTSPASMCKAIRGHDLFAALLKAMNNNTDSGPNLPVINQSFLLDGPLKNVVYTSSDSIRQAQGSIYRAADGLFPGVYTVLSGTVNYNGGVFTTGQKFTFVNTADSFTGDGVVQKTQSIAIGATYDAGDTLQAGGTYIVEGPAGEHATYNGINYPVGQFFKYVLGVTTFTRSSDSVFVKQTAEDPQLIISFKDFFQDVLSENGGQVVFGIENQPIGDGGALVPVCFLEDMNYIYRTGIIGLKVGEVDETTNFQPATDKMGNSIKAGYNDQQYDAVNGAQEVNSTQIYQTVLLSPVKEINLVSLVRADPYGIETVRITQNDSAASRSDNDTFKIWIKSGAETPIGGSGIFAGFVYWHPLRSEGYTSLTGVDPSYYNYLLSPKQCLLRGGNYLASIFFGMKGYQITMASAPKNSAMVFTGLDGKRVAESDPIPVSSLPAPLFLPFYAEVTPGLPQNALDILDMNYSNEIQFTYNNADYKGFIEEIGVDAGQNSKQLFKLLLSPDNDVTKLIR